MSPRKAPAHGTPARYFGTRSGSRPPCRCRPCTDAHTKACAQRLLDHSKGRPPRVPTQPVHNHVRELLKRGMSCTQIALAAHVSVASVANAASGKNATFNRTTAEKILAVRPCFVRPTDRVPATGTRRRLQALYAIGHGSTAISAATGITAASIQNLVYERTLLTTAATYQAVKTAYRGLVAQPGSSTRAKTSALRGGWAPPTSWGDDIDAPNAAPEQDCSSESELKRNDLAAHRRAEVEHLSSCGLSEHEIAGRLEMAYTTVRNIVLELRSGQRRVRPPEGRNAPLDGYQQAA